MYQYEYPHPAVTTDIVIFTVRDNQLKLLLIMRGGEPFKGEWALPGGFVRLDETIDEAARRELQEETGLDNVFLEQLCTIGDLDRDPRERIVTVAHYALVRLSDHRVQAATDAREAAWFGMDDLPNLAFDHDNILKVAHERLRNKVRYQPIGFELLPAKFALRELQHLYEVILDKELDKRNFRKKILGMGILLELEEVEKDVSHRAARLYKFDRKKYRRITKQGFNFEI
jgi:8-oxo-dGTP diphosphatase